MKVLSTIKALLFFVAGILPAICPGLHCSETGETFLVGGALFFAAIFVAMEFNLLPNWAPTPVMIGAFAKFVRSGR